MTPILELHGISAGYDGKTVLRNVDFTIEEGDFIGIIGPNGGGKTTLLRIILKLLRPTSGSVEYFCDGISVRNLHIGYLPQKNMVDSRFPITVDELVATGLLGSDKSMRDRSSQLTAEMLRTVGLDDRAGQVIGTLSGGQLQRALLGRALISRPSVIVLDEPLSYVDKHFEHFIYDLLDRIRHDVTILLVSHEMSVISGMANRHFIIDHTLEECHSHHHSVHYDCDSSD